jgi:hypothetical protein
VRPSPLVPTPGGTTSPGVNVGERYSPLSVFVNEM